MILTYDVGMFWEPVSIVVHVVPSSRAVSTLYWTLLE